jgi:hypothetical protein
MCIISPPRALALYISYYTIPYPLPAITYTSWFHFTLSFPHHYIAPLPSTPVTSHVAQLSSRRLRFVFIYSIDSIFARVRCTAFWWSLTRFSRVIYCTLYHHHSSSPSLPAGSSILIFLHHSSCLHANSRFVIVSFPLLLPSIPVLPSLFIPRCLFAAFVRNANC